MSVGHVYFIRNVENRMIKIGWSIEVLQRVRALQVGNSERLVLEAAMPASIAAERALHARFAALHKSGEWFAPDQALEALIRAIADAFALPEQPAPPVPEKGWAAVKTSDDVADEAARLIEIIAGEWTRKDRRTLRQDRVAQATGFTPRRIRAFMYREAKIISAAEIERLRDIAEGRVRPMGERTGAAGSED